MKPLYVQIKCELGRAYEVADALIDTLEETSEVYSTSGDYDLMAKFYLAEDQSIAGIRDTHTILAFRLFGASEQVALDEGRR